MASRAPWDWDETAPEDNPPIHLLSSEGWMWIVITTLCGLMIVGILVIHDLSLQLNRLQSTAITCQEDMPCWDCTTMGNKICGPR